MEVVAMVALARAAAATTKVEMEMATRIATMAVVVATMLLPPPTPLRFNVATSSCEAKYRAVFIATIECVWLRRLMADLGVGQNIDNTIYTESQSVLAVVRNPVFHGRTKHIEVHYHYVRKRLSAGEISLAYVPAQDNLADLFTKALSREKLEAFHKALGLLPFVD
ncbi:hypothetical protein L7F22_016038 [Adiantum nelumboides]|nr:hypothetical protein [Adiantum nelumboides]